MRPKTIATRLLLAFVVLSIGVLVGKELRPGATRPEGVAPPGSRIAQAKAEIPAPRVIAYYFHGTARCVTCKKIEAFAREAIGESFPDAIQDGRLEVRSVDYEEPENEHFLEDYRLPSPSLVLVAPRMTGAPARGRSSRGCGNSTMTSRPSLPTSKTRSGSSSGRTEARERWVRSALGIGSALWLGLLTSISPCPLATNVAAMSFIGRRVGNARLVVLTGLV